MYITFIIICGVFDFWLQHEINIIIYIYIIYTIVNRKIKVPTGGIYTIYYPVAVINDIH